MVTLSVMAALYLATSVSAANCPPGYVYLPKAHSCYVMLSQPATWEDGSKRCEGFSPTAHLAVIDNADEDAAVTEYLDSMDYNEIYFCMADYNRTAFYTSGQRVNPKECSQDFVWEFSDGAVKEMQYTTGWESGYPNCESYDSACLVFYSDNTTAAHKWRNVNCGTSWCSLCEDIPL